MDPHDEYSNGSYSTNSNTIVPADYFISSSPSVDQYFSIEVECKIFYASNGVIMDAATDTIECGVTMVPKENIEQFIYMVFAYFDVPENAQPHMAAKILRCAEEIMNEAPKNQQILDLYIVLVHTSHVHYYDDDDDDAAADDDGAVEESMNENEDMRIIPASESSIEGLEKVNFEQKEGSSKGKFNCAICLEDFSTDSEAVRMPCFHLFHKICITTWLHNRNTCPLCRFQMPTEDDE